MPAFPRKLKEIKERQEKERRKKPNKSEGPPLGPKFELANTKEVKHLHREDLEKKTLKDLEPVLDAETFEDLKNGTLTIEDLKDGFNALEEIFKWILGETSRLLDEVNQGLADFTATGNQKKYDDATAAFNKFVDKLNDPAVDANGSFGATINAANIEPVQDGGYYTSARVVIAWLGGTHSGSSLIHVP